MILTIIVIVAAVWHSPTIQAASRVRGSFWADHSDSGGCQLPQADYDVLDAVALGQSVDLGDLAYRPAMCGQVLRIDCGVRSTYAVVVSSCDIGDKAPNHCALDMVKQTWDKTTGSMQPGLTHCSVSLSSQNAIAGGAMLCYNRPFTDPTPYYLNLGVMNTGGELVVSASVNGIQGKFSNGAWMDFNASGTNLFSGDSVVQFTFESGKKVSFRLSECRNSTGVQIFS